LWRIGKSHNKHGQIECDKEFYYDDALLQLNHALSRQKTLFENVNVDWNLSHDEGSTDFSDDETIIEDRVSKLYYLLLVYFYAYNFEFENCILLPV
jgi:hypothetical protein